MKLTRSQFDALALEHMEMLYRLARRMTFDTAAAEDLVQETYVHAYKGLDHFTLQEFGVRPWLIQIMRNLAISRARRERLGPKPVDDERLTEAADESSPVSGQNATSFTFDMMDQRLAGAVKELSPDAQQMLWMWAVQEMSYKEIAAACNVAIGTIMSRLHRIREKLVEKLAKKGVDDTTKLE